MKPTAPFELIVISASTDGIGAISRILSELPADWPIPVAVVQHRGIPNPNMLPLLLGRCTPLRVKLALDGESLQPGTVYVNNPDCHLVVTADKTLSSRDGTRICYLLSSANPLLISAAEVFDGRVIAVVLTGAGSDSTDGVQAVRARGGVVIAQDPSTTATAGKGMPSSAIKSGAVTHILSLGEIGPMLRELVLDGAKSTQRVQPVN